MQKPSDLTDWETRKERVIGLGERSFRKSYYPQLQENLERLKRFRGLLDHTSDFVVLVTLPEAIVVDANAALGQLLGTPVEELIGQPLFSLGLLNEETSSSLFQSEGAQRSPDDHASTPSFVVEFVRPSGTRWLELTCRTAVLDGCCYGAMVGRDITERKHSEDLLRSSERRFRMALMNSQVTVFEQDRELRYLSNYRPYFQHSPETIVGKFDRDFLDPDSAALLEKIKSSVIETGTPVREEICISAPGSTSEYFDLYVEPQHDEGGRICGILCTAVDITERKRADAALRESEEQFRTIAASAHDAIIMMNVDGVIGFWNPAAEAIFGYTESEAIGASLVHVLPPETYARTFAADLTNFHIEDGGVPAGRKLELDVRRKDGVEISIEFSTSFVKHRNEWKAISIARDISDQKAHQAELERVANYDALTGLPNRRLFSDRIHQGMAHCWDSGTNMAVCYLDLDNFKPINDRYGHEIGDQVLAKMAEHIQKALRTEDTLARLGGDEFVVLLTHFHSVDEIFLVLDRVLSAISAPIATQSITVNLTGSIGVALFPADNVDPDTLLRHADQAMYVAKRSGKNCYRLFDQEHDQKIQTYIHSQQRLREALANREFVVYYQPMVDMSDGKIVGVEALIRWQHPQRGLLPPAEFLPYIMGSDLEIAIGEWVISTVLRHKASWDVAGMVLNASINISPGHLLHADFAERLAMLLQHYPAVDPGQVELEILETAAISDMQHAVRAVDRCRELGVKIALDDFGTGYSSLTYLRNLPVDVLKIDQSFVRDMLSDPSDLAIVVSVVQLAKAFNRTVIAEGVETLEHGARLVQIGCRLMQGYGIARPMPAEQVAGWFGEWHEKAAWRALTKRPVDSVKPDDARYNQFISAMAK